MTAEQKEQMDVCKYPMMDFIEILFNLRPKEEENIVSINRHYAVPDREEKFLFICFLFIFFFILWKEERIFGVGWVEMGEDDLGGDERG